MTNSHLDFPQKKNEPSDTRQEVTDSLKMGVNIGEFWKFSKYITRTSIDRSVPSRSTTNINLLLSRILSHYCFASYNATLHAPYILPLYNTRSITTGMCIGIKNPSLNKHSFLKRCTDSSPIDWPPPRHPHLAC